MKTLQLDERQVSILLRLLNDYIGLLKDEPDNSYGGEERRDCQDIFDQLTRRD